VSREAEEVVGLLKNELKLTMAYLQIHPKVYWIWNHRKWCLEHVPLGPAAPQVSAEGVVHGKEDEAAEGEKSEGITEEWRIGFWKGELAVIEALLDADPRNCMSSLPFFPLISTILTLSTLTPSPRMGLSSICTLIPSFLIHPTPNPSSGTRIYKKED